MPPQMPSASGSSAAQALNANLAARQLVIANSLPRLNLLTSQTVTPSSNNTLNISPSYTGLLRRFYVEVIATLTNGAGGTATLTDVGVPNLLSQVTMTDTSNYQRINTTGTHLYLLSSFKRRHPFGATANWNTASSNNLAQEQSVASALWPVFTAPQTIAASTPGTVRAVFEIPACYNDHDLRGSIFLNQNNATMQLTLTFNTSAMVGAAPADYTNAVYQGSTGTFTSATVNVYQDYLDQLPTNNGQFVLPLQDLGTAYVLNNTTFTGMAANSEFYFPYLNFRDFESSIVIYNNNGQATGRTVGTDINYFKLLTANFVPIWQRGALTNAMLSRNLLLADLPAGFHYFDHRVKPISTLAQGNMQLVINPLTVNSGAYANVLWEALGPIQSILSGGSLPGGGQ